VESEARQEQHVQDQGKDLQDIAVGLGGISFELEKVATILRALAIDRLGEDPLEGYYEDDEATPMSPATSPARGGSGWELDT